MSELPFRLFDRTADYEVIERKLPHWVQPGTLTFITFRTVDSLPAHVIEQWVRLRADLIRKQGIDPQAVNCEQLLRQLPKSVQDEIDNCLSEKWHDNLDACHGECVLRRPELAKIVADSFHKFENDRYFLSDFVIMPNHCHLLASFPDEQSMLDQCESWKHFTAREINRRLKQRGRFWQQDGFDHLVRSEDQFRWLRKYIAENPKKAGLNVGEFLHWCNSGA